MLGSLTMYTSKGNYVLTLNGGHMTIRRESDKPFQARKIETSDPLWNAVMKHIYGIEDLIKDSGYVS